MLLKWSLLLASQVLKKSSFLSWHEREPWLVVWQWPVNMSFTYWQNTPTCSMFVDDSCLLATVSSHRHHSQAPMSRLFLLHQQFCDVSAVKYSATVDLSPAAVSAISPTTTRTFITKGFNDTCRQFVAQTGDLDRFRCLSVPICRPTRLTADNRSILADTHSMLGRSWAVSEPVSQKNCKALYLQ